MYAKIFAQIFDSSIAEDYRTRHVFMDLLVLADRCGIVDMTFEAIARRTNVPLEVIRVSIVKLCEPDVNSRSKTEDGRRLIPLDDRGWGWRIVNFEEYHRLKDEDAKRDYHRDYMRKRRSCEPPLTSVKSRESKLRHVDVNVDVDVDVNKTQGAQTAARGESKASPSPKSTPEIPKDLDTYTEYIRAYLKHRAEMKKPVRPSGLKALFEKMRRLGERLPQSIEESLANGWQGLFEPKGNANGRDYNPARIEAEPGKYADVGIRCDIPQTPEARAERERRPIVEQNW